MRVNRAWCVELQRLVRISEAQAAYFAQPEPRRRLSYQCADPSCRQRTQARIQGVHDDRLFVSDAFPAAAHFAEVAQSAHDPACEYRLRRQAVEAIAGSRESVRADLNVSRRFAMARPIDVYDVYRPAVPGPVDEGDGVFEEGAAPASSAPVGDDSAAAAARVAELESKLRSNSLRTRRLADVIGCFTELGAVDRQKALIRLPGGKPLPYAAFVQPLARYDDLGPPVIRVGGARVSRHDAQGVFELRFFDRVVIGGERFEVILRLEDARVARSPLAALLNAQLSAAAGAGCHARVFFFGGVAALPNATSQAEIRISELDNLVIHPMRAGDI